jgi:hypothetical protein
MCVDIRPNVANVAPNMVANAALLLSWATTEPSPAVLVGTVLITICFRGTVTSTVIFVGGISLRFGETFLRYGEKLATNNQKTPTAERNRIGKYNLHNRVFASRWNDCLSEGFMVVSDENESLYSLAAFVIGSQP